MKLIFEKATFFGVAALARRNSQQLPEKDCSGTEGKMGKGEVGE
jgi:hypothetical protein